MGAGNQSDGSMCSAGFVEEDLSIHTPVTGCHEQLRPCQPNQMALKGGEMWGSLYYVRVHSFLKAGV